MAAVRPVVLATGGTGGHVFPAEALAGELEARGVPFALITDSRGRQWQGALSRRPIHYIHSASPTGSMAQKAMAIFSLAFGLFDAWRALGRIGPSAVVGFGGYASVPTMLVDIRSFGGDSGGPLFVLVDGKPHVAGVLVGMQRQTDRTVSPFEERTVHTPLGLGIAVQADLVARVIGGL